MDKTEPRKPCYGSRVRATPWRRAERRLQVPPGGLFIVLPAWSVRAPSSALSPTGRQIVHRRVRPAGRFVSRSEEHTSELQSLMRISYAVFCLKKKKKNTKQPYYRHSISRNQEDIL